MKTMCENISNSGFFSLEKVSCTAIIRFLECPFSYGTDLEAKKQLLKCIDEISRDEDIKVIMLFSASESKGCESFFNICRKIGFSDTDKFAFERMQNAVSQYIMKIVNIDKIVVHVDCRKSIPLFMNLGLACNYRIICDEAVFHTKNTEIGLLPKGGEIYFLNKIIGVKNTSEIFLLGKEISAKEALAIGLVNEAVPFEKLEKASFRVASEISKKPSYILSAIKKLLNTEVREIQSTLEFEKQIGSLMVISKKFHKKIGACSWNDD
jgi:2-(1,2-epoxy-1,2-dihydrophenyl)acetyl-CoA isomerase